ncbi:Dnmt3b, partial [Symbiodinium necroappetens]
MGIITQILLSLPPHLVQIIRDVVNSPDVRRDIPPPTTCLRYNQRRDPDDNLHAWRPEPSTQASSFSSGSGQASQAAEASASPGASSTVYTARHEDSQVSGKAADRSLSWNIAITQDTCVHAMAKAQQDALRRCLQDARLPDSFIQYCVGDLKMASLEDFVNIVTIKDYEQELKTVLTDNCADTKDQPLQLSRARAAWRAVRTILLRQEHRRQQGEPVEELDVALEPSTQETLLQQFKASYNLSIDVHYMPGDTLLGRLFRECQRMAPTVISISK